jgi:hypothetical protein
VHAHHLYGRIVRAPMPLPAPSAPMSSVPDIAITTRAESIRHETPNASADALTYERLDDGSAFVRCFDRFEFLVSPDGRSICAHRAPEATDESLFAYLLGHGLSVALLLQNVEGLHAAAFVKDGHAIAILGDSGYGKSTLLAHAVQAGARLLTDDLLVLDRAMVLPGPARIKLDPAIAQATLGPRNGTPMYDDRGKWIYELTADEFANGPAELVRIYTLQPDAAEISVEPLSEARAFHALLAATFNPLEKSAARLAFHMRYHAALARSIPVFRLHVPRRIADIGKVLERL